MQVNIPLDLETECWACDGTGTPRRATDADENGKCEYCDGVGTRLTDFGYAVIEMLNRHKSKLK
jgi:hypothetical protein